MKNKLIKIDSEMVSNFICIMMFKQLLQLNSLCLKSKRHRRYNKTTNWLLESKLKHLGWKIYWVKWKLLNIIEDIFQNKWNPEVMLTQCTFPKYIVKDTILKTVGDTKLLNKHLLFSWNVKRWSQSTLLSSMPTLPVRC